MNDYYKTDSIKQVMSLLQEGRLGDYIFTEKIKDRVITLTPNGVDLYKANYGIYAYFILICNDIFNDFEHVGLNIRLMFNEYNDVFRIMTDFNAYNGLVLDVKDFEILSSHRHKPLKCLQQDCVELIHSFKLMVNYMNENKEYFKNISVEYSYEKNTKGSSRDEYLIHLERNSHYPIRKLKDVNLHNLANTFKERLEKYLMLLDVIALDLPFKKRDKL